MKTSRPDEHLGTIVSKELERLQQKIELRKEKLEEVQQTALDLLEYIESLHEGFDLPDLITEQMLLMRFYSISRIGSDSDEE